MAAGQRDDSCLFMAAFVLSVYVYVYLRSKEGCLAQASFVGVLRAKPEKKSQSRRPMETKKRAGQRKRRVLGAGKASYS